MIACPKCGADRKRAETSGACAVCGLQLMLWAEFDDTPPPHPALDAAFATLEEAWNDTKAHDAFLALAGNFDALDAAAHRYRRWLRSRPQDIVAQRALQKAAQFIVAAAKARHENAPEEVRRSLFPLKVAGTLVALFFAILAGVTLYRAVMQRTGGGFSRMTD